MLSIFEHKPGNKKSHFWRLYIIQCRKFCSVTLYCSLNKETARATTPDDMANCQGCVTCFSTGKRAGSATQYLTELQYVRIDPPSLRKRPKGMLLTFECVWNNLCLILVTSLFLDYIQQLHLGEKKIMASQKLKLNGKMWWGFGRGVIFFLFGYSFHWNV